VAHVLADVDWVAVVDALVARGWARLERAAEPAFAAQIEAAAPGPWTSLPPTEGGAGVRQAGRSCHSEVSDGTGPVASLAAAIKDGVDSVTGAGLPPLPAFNHADWCRADDGQKFITAHRDPIKAGGVIAVLTIRGRAPFRVWDFDGTTADAAGQPELAECWETADGDLVLMRGGGWPTATSQCPIHEAQSPVGGERVTLTLRHNIGGYGADYFS
jgi:hypothetical protein